MKENLKPQDLVFMQRLNLVRVRTALIIKKDIEVKENEKKTLLINSETNFWKSLFRIL
jgi:hypothetical protein